MSTNHHDDHNQKLQPEDSGIKAQPILTFLIILGVSTAAVFFIVKGLLWGFAKMDERNPQTPATLVSAPNNRKLPPEPLLQGAPGPGSTETKDVATQLPLDEMKTYRAQVEAKAIGFGWVNKETGVAHISIERAKDIVAEKGLPLRPEAAITELERAAATRKVTLNADSSGGRVIQRQSAAAESSRQEAAADSRKQEAAAGGSMQPVAPEAAKPAAHAAGAKH
jgi:hypothetical protein